MATTATGWLTEALDATGQLVVGVRGEQWSDPTPCTDWTVRDLVNHLVAGNRLLSGLLRGEPSPSRSIPRGIDQLGAELVVAYRGAAAELLAAFELPGVMQRVVSVPLGSVPGVVALHLRLIEAIVHGWDLAKATGQALQIPDELAGQELQFTREKPADVRPGTRPFGPPQPVAPDDPALDLLAACLGRSVGTTHAGT